jgi:hypothetical protein
MFFVPLRGRIRVIFYLCAAFAGDYFCTPQRQLHATELTAALELVLRDSPCYQLSNASRTVPIHGELRELWPFLCGDFKINK